VKLCLLLLQSACLPRTVNIAVVLWAQVALPGD
jgi:hypothetical protein